ncbi:MAG TPA: molecular chaperone DnaK [Candidatus Sabulitectum sp.]|mgnify:CR=1 FL=1|nr:molecular chaperone DnaK [Candidatus Sabulitectum sp.]HPJ27512.1 molecular chaperone DnaK [Candidatus Sabulitectum sp.]HPR21514.1 molecular chaperone DnaK [Candidatus Sabulitectum sp.]
MGRTIGIDLGTTNSCIAFSDGGHPTVIQSKSGSRVMPSVVAFSAKGERLVGLVARRQAITNPRNTISSVKRLMGRRYSEVVDQVDTVSYEIVENTNGDAAVRVMDRVYTPPEVSAIILQKLKQTAEEFLGEEVTDVVITVPAYFNEVQREATKAAGKIAGLNVKRVLNEPTAAALAFLEPKGKTRIAVYDFGGGTFDISILQVVEGVFEVKATLGDTSLGGDDLDTQLVNWIMAEFLSDTGIDLNKDAIAPQRVREAAERAKCELSMAQETDINLPFIATGESGPVHLEIKITRKLFEELAGDLIRKTIPLCLDAVSDAGMKMEDLDHVVLVGGSTRIPMVQQLVEETFGRKPAQSVNPDEVVALGAAIESSVLTGQRKDLVLIDVTPLTLGVETLGGVMTPIIQRNSPVPTRNSRIFTTASDNQSVVGVHVAQGERDLIDGNRSLGTFELRGIKPAKRGEPRVEVTFEIDASGILNVSARDTSTGQKQSIKVNPSGGLSSDEIERLKKEAAANAEADRRRMKLVGLRNESDEAIYRATKTLKVAREELEKESWEELEAAVKELKKLRDGDDALILGKAISTLRSLTDSVAKLVAVFESDEEQAAAEFLESMTDGSEEETPEE